MGWFEAIVLGIVQGLTEFLPISSSAHVSIVGQLLFDGRDPGAAFTAVTPRLRGREKYHHRPPERTGGSVQSSEHSAAFCKREARSHLRYCNAGGAVDRQCDDGYSYRRYGNHRL